MSTGAATKSVSTSACRMSSEECSTDIGLLAPFLRCRRPSKETELAAMRDAESSPKIPRRRGIHVTPLHNRKLTSQNYRSRSW
jgi:hypothetical protein